MDHPVDINLQSIPAVIMGWQVGMVDDFKNNFQHFVYPIAKNHPNIFIVFKVTTSTQISLLYLDEMYCM